MQLSLPDPDTLFEELLQDLPPETVHRAREFKAFVQAKKDQRAHDVPFTTQTRLHFDVILPLWGRRGPR